MTTHDVVFLSDIDGIKEIARRATPAVVVYERPAGGYGCTLVASLDRCRRLVHVLPFPGRVAKRYTSIVRLKAFK